MSLNNNILTQYIMNELPSNAGLKEIIAYKRKVTWGDVPTIFHMAQSSISELDGLLSHGFNNPFKRLLNKSHWNIELLEGFYDTHGDLQVKHKPQISLKHVYDEQNYELHCFPVMQGERVHQRLIKHPLCPFEKWAPESMQILFRVNNIVAFMLYSFKSGDEADMALIKYTHITITNLIEILSESFEIVDIIGYSIAQFCKELEKRRNLLDTKDLFNSANDNTE